MVNIRHFVDSISDCIVWLRNRAPASMEYAQEAMNLKAKILINLIIHSLQNTDKGNVIKKLPEKHKKIVKKVQPPNPQKMKCILQNLYTKT